MSVETKYFEFRQNNVRGEWVHKAKEGIGSSVFIEAVDHRHANARAEELLDWGDYCECCGARWHRMEDWEDPVDLPRCQGHYRKVPAYVHPLSGKHYALPISDPDRCECADD